jgi:CO/xanthine dehydrogenase Mo-binding subunit
VGIIIAPGTPSAAAVAHGPASAGTIVGRSVPRRDAAAKLAGRARYVADLRVPGTWHGVTVRAAEPRARLLGIDLDLAFDWSRVVVLTAADVPGENVVHLIVDDQPVLVAEEIRHVGEPVALIAAPDLPTALAARDHITLRTETLPPVLDPLASERSFAAYEIVKGDTEAGFAEADLVIEGTYAVGRQEQLYIETQGMLAVPREDGGVTVHGSLQCPYYVHAALRRALALDDSQFSVAQAETGGGFGGKEEFPSGLAIHAAMLAMRCGHPVRMIYDRHEDLVATTKRHPAVVRSRMGVTRDGRLVAQDIDVVMDAGAYATLSGVVLSRGTIHAGGPYRCPNVRIRSRAVMTNTPPSGAFRGFGAPQTEFAAEMQVNRAAEALGVSPAALRARWAYGLGDRTATGQVLRDSVGARSVLDRVLEASRFEDVRAATARARARHEAGDDAARDAGPGGRGRAQEAAGREHLAHGIGVAMGWHGAGFTGSGEEHLASVVRVEVTADGRIVLATDSTEIGQGSRTVLPQLVAEELGVDVNLVEVAPMDTAIVPNSGPTVASRTTMVIGGLLVTAARRLRAEVEGRTGRPFAESYADDARDHGPADAVERFAGYPGVEWDEATHRGDAYPAYGWAAATAEVDVDLDTGEVTVRSVVAADDVGRAVNPLLATGQVEGGTLQGVGYATIEETRLENGRVLNDRMATYLVPTAMDAPRIEAILVEEPFAGAPHRAKGLGELPMDVPAPAVVAAIHDATGVWIHDLPASPERILAALGERP